MTTGCGCGLAPKRKKTGSSRTFKHYLSSMSWNRPRWRRLRYPHSKCLSLWSMWLGKAIAIQLPSCQFPYSSFHQANERDDSGTRQEVATAAEDHRDPENPDHSTALVLCRVMSSYGQVWNPWRVKGGIVTTFFSFLRFTKRFVSLCCFFICRTDTRVEYCFILCFTHHFTCRFTIVSYIVSTIYMFERIVYIVDTELSLASL